MEENISKPNLSAMAEKWSSGFVARQEVENFTGGVMTAKYMEWLDSQGLGVKDRVRIGRKIAYPVASLLELLESRAEFVEKK